MDWEKAPSIPMYIPSITKDNFLIMLFNDWSVTSAPTACFAAICAWGAFTVHLEVHFKFFGFSWCKFHLCIIQINFLVCLWRCTGMQHARTADKKNNTNKSDKFFHKQLLSKWTDLDFSILINFEKCGNGILRGRISPSLDQDQQ